VVEYNPYSWETHDDPYPVYRALRDEAPVYYNEQLEFWALSRHADVQAALRAPHVFSSANGVALEAMGTHFCLGASLARLEGRVALEEVQRRLPDFQVNYDGLVRIHSGNVRGYASLPITV